MDINPIVAKLTPEEKAELVSGQDSWYIAKIPEAGLYGIRVSDGPHGLRKVDDILGGLNKSVQATCFPPAVTLASTFNIELAEEEGMAIGEECLENKVDIILGPGINIKRNPLCGRNFEYFSEDPYLAGKIGTSYVKGVQSKGVGVSLKHYCCNNEEEYRFICDSEVDERALREIYLKPFEMVVKDAKPATIMASYNKINGVPATENRKTLFEILRMEWNYGGVVMSDWGAVQDRVKSLINGTDLEMPGGVAHHKAQLIEAMKNGTLDNGAINRACNRIVDLTTKLKANEKPNFTCDHEAHNKLAAKIATEGAVLLKNENNALPLAKEENVCFIGSLCEEMRYQGLGSSHVNPLRLIQPLKAIKEYGPYAYATGYVIDSDKEIPELEQKAVDLASHSDKIIFFAGLPPLYESEGFDRKDMKLPYNQLRLLDRIISLKKKVVVVLFVGSPVELPFVDEVDGILNMYLPGQAGGTAVARILFGEAEPSGRLPETWPKHLEDVPSYHFFDNDPQKAEYRESIYVGYRYYDKAKVEPLFPFGYGLSYTTFEYSDLDVKDNDTEFGISFKVKNTGMRLGSEVAQLYIGQEDTGVFKTSKQLKRFIKIQLDPGEERTITFTLDYDVFAYYNTRINEYVIETGFATIMIGRSSENILLKKQVRLNGRNDVSAAVDPSEVTSYFSLVGNNFPKDQFEAVLGRKVPENYQKLPLDENSMLADFKLTRNGRKVYKLIMKILNRQLDKAQKMKNSDPNKKAKIRDMQLFIRILPNETIYNAMGNAGAKFTLNKAKGLLYYANGHFFKGIFYLLFKK